MRNLGDDAFHHNTTVEWNSNYVFKNNVFLKVLSYTTDFTIPISVAGKTITQIGSSAFSGQNQLTQINIPSTVTHIGIEAFKNTNNAPIYLEGRTSVPQTFRNNWNSSGNPVYLDGNLCTHPTTTLKSCCSSLHGDLCDTL